MTFCFLKFSKNEPMQKFDDFFALESKDKDTLSNVKQPLITN